MERDLSYWKLEKKLILTFSTRTGLDEHVKKEILSTDYQSTLNLLKTEYPNFSFLVNGKRVLDFGCGYAEQAIAIAKCFECSVTGIDSNRETLNKAAKNKEMHGLDDDRLLLVDHVDKRMLRSFDVVISQNSFEHFSDPDAVLKSMISLLSEDGIILLTFGPPWYAPYGSHMHFFCRLPWINIFFSEKAVMSARSEFRNDGAAKYEDVESGLNKMSIRKFEQLLTDNDLTFFDLNYKCVKGLNWLSKIPLMRELFVNRVTVTIKKTNNPEVGP